MLGVTVEEQVSFLEYAAGKAAGFLSFYTDDVQDPETDKQHHRNRAIGEEMEIFRRGRVFF